MIVAGTENASIYQDIRFVDDLNSYVNKLSEFMTTKSVYLDTDKQRMVLEEDSNFKMLQQQKQYRLRPDSDESDTNIAGDPDYEEFEDDNKQIQLENF